MSMSDTLGGKRLGSAVLLQLLLLLPLDSLADVPIVYFSPADDGLPAGIGEPLPAATSATIPLYLDGGSTTSTQSTCAAGNGDEVCGFDLAFEPSGALQFVDFVAAPGVAFSVTPTRLDVVGGNPWRGGLGPQKIGDLILDSSEVGSLQLLQSQSLDASLGLQAIPAMTVPEPGFGMALLFGVATLCGLRRRRRIEVLPRHSKRTAAAVAVLLMAPLSASAQGTPICGDVVPDGTLDIADLDRIEDFLANKPGAIDLESDPALLARCDVAPNGFCDIQDFARIRRSLLNASEGIAETCTGNLPTTIVRPAPTLDPSSPSATDRASVRLSGTTRLPLERIEVDGGVVRRMARIRADGRFFVDVPLALGQPNVLTVRQIFGPGVDSEPAVANVTQTDATGTSRLEGRFLDAETGEPIEATVDLEISGIPSQTDAFGRFDVPDLPEGLVVILAEGTGFAPEVALAKAGVITRPTADTDVNFVPIEIRLTRRASPNFVDSAGAALTTPSGFELVVPSGSLSGPTELRLTELTGKDTPTPGALPLVEIGPGPVVFDPPAMLRLPISDPEAAGAVIELLQLDHTDLSATALVGTVAASGFLEVPIAASNGDSLFYQYSTGPITFGKVGLERKFNLTIAGKCDEEVVEPLELYPTPGSTQFIPWNPESHFGERLTQDPTQILNGGIKVDWLSAIPTGLSMEVPQGTIAKFEITVVEFAAFFEVYAFSLAAGGTPPERAGTLVSSRVIDENFPPTLERVELTFLDCDAPEAGAYGDPHLIRFDHVGEAIDLVRGDGTFDFQGGGEFILFESVEDDMVVQVRMEAANNSTTVITAAAMDVDGTRVSIYTAPVLDVRVDGVATPLTTGVPLPLVGGGELERSTTPVGKDLIWVRWNDGSEMHVSEFSNFISSSFLNLFPSLSRSRSGAIRGLLGNANGILTDDYVLRGGQPAIPAELYTTFADSWRISQAESLFDYLPGEDSTTYNGVPVDPDYTVDDLDPVVAAAAEADCVLAGITEEPWLAACIIDVAVFGDTGLTETAVNAQAEVPIDDTRVTISGPANIFAAGLGSPLDFGGGGGVGVVPPEVALPSGTNRILRILDAAGGAQATPSASPTGPDGSIFVKGPIEWGEWGGLSGPITHRTSPLMAVFLSDDARPATPPAPFDCREQSATVVVPEIGQIFCVGDGLSAERELTAILVPDAATRVFFGHAERAWTVVNALTEAGVEHLGDETRSDGLFSLAPSAVGAISSSTAFAVSTASADGARVVVDLADTEAADNEIWVNGQFAARIPQTGAVPGAWALDQTIGIPLELFQPTGNLLELRAGESGGDVDDWLFQNLRVETISNP